MSKDTFDNKNKTEQAIVWFLEQLFGGERALCQYTIVSVDDNYKPLEKRVIPKGEPLYTNHRKAVNRVLARIRVYKRKFGLEDTRQLLDGYVERLDELGYESKLDRLLERDSEAA